MTTSDARRCRALVRAARTHGATSLAVEVDGERIDDGTGNEDDLVECMLAADECIVAARGPGIRTNFLIVLGNDEDGPIADLNDTPFGNLVFEETLKA